MQDLGHRGKQGFLIAALILTLAVTLPGAAQAKAHHPLPHPPQHALYVASYNGDCTNVLSVVKHQRVTRSWEPAGGPCTAASAMAVGHTIRTLGARPEFTGAEYSLAGVPSGVTYDYPSSIFMDLPDGTTDGASNYAGGYFDGVVYRFTRDWKDPVPLFSTGLYLGGIAYDPRTDTMWVLDSRIADEGGSGEIMNYTMDGTLLSSFTVEGGSDPQPFGLAYDAPHQTLWISRNRGFDTPALLEEYSTSGTHLGSLTPGVEGVIGGLEFRLPRAR